MASGYDVFLDLNVDKGEHHAMGLDPAGKRLHDAWLPNSEPKLRALFGRLAAHDRVLVVHQPATIGALPVTVARACGHEVGYLPGLVMRRIADLYPSNAKTDARDAFVIADAARTMTHTLRRVDVGDDALAELDVLVGFDDDLAAETTRVSNRIRGLLTGIHPHLPRPTPLRRPVRHAPRQNPLPDPDTSTGLTRSIGTPRADAATWIAFFKRKRMALIRSSRPLVRSGHRN